MANVTVEIWTPGDDDPVKHTVTEEKAAECAELLQDGNAVLTFYPAENRRSYVPVRQITYMTVSPA